MISGSVSILRLNVGGSMTSVGCRGTDGDAMIAIWYMVRIEDESTEYKNEGKLRDGLIEARKGRVE